MPSATKTASVSTVLRRCGMKIEMKKAAPMRAKKMLNELRYTREFHDNEDEMRLGHALGWTLSGLETRGASIANKHNPRRERLKTRLNEIKDEVKDIEKQLAQLKAEQEKLEKQLKRKSQIIIEKAPAKKKIEEEPLDCEVCGDHTDSEGACNNPDCPTYSG
jgi:septal ring factor EnvC (AmiA/AmiB activator)